MAKRSPPELKETSELRCNWGLLNIRESRQVRADQKLIFSEKPVKEHIIFDYPRKFEQLASFDEQCRIYQNEADLASVSVDAITRSVRNPMQEDMSIKKHKDRQIVVEEQPHKETDSDSAVKSQTRRRKKSQNVYQPSHHLNHSASLIPRLTSTSAGKPPSKLTVAAILGEAHDQNHWEDQLRKYGLFKEINMRQVQMSAQAFADKMFIDRNFIYKESKPFSSALEVLNSDKHFFMKPNPQPSNEIVIMKPLVPRSAKYSENISCHCSLMQSHPKLSKKLPSEKGKHTSFSFREMKRRLKHKFRGSRNEPNKFSVDCTSQKLSRNRLALNTGDGCMYHGVDTRKCFPSSANEMIKEKLCEKEEFLSNTRTDKVREKLDFPSERFSEFDIILEAKRHLYARLKNMNKIESPTSKRFARTLGRILSSPERDGKFCSPQMRFSSCSTSPSSTCNQVPNERERTSQNPPRPIKDVLSFCDHKKQNDTLEIFSGTKTVCSLFQNTDEAHDTVISPTENIKSYNGGSYSLLLCKFFTSINYEGLKIFEMFLGESETLEMNSFQQPGLHITEVPTDTVKLHGSTMQSPWNSISANETITSRSDDFVSPPSSICQLDAPDSIKDREVHQSPVSVLEPFFTEDADSPPSYTLQTERQPLKPRRLDFDDCSFDAIPQDQPINDYVCIDEQDYVPLYILLVMEASHLNWDQLSQLRSLPEELLHESLFDEVGFLPNDRLFESKLLFDHINEVLIQICESHCCFPWVGSLKQGIKSVPLEDLVLDGIMKEADFYLFPRSDNRTLDQLVSKDVVCSRSWLNVGMEKEQIVIDISEDVVEDSILDTILDFLI